MKVIDPGHVYECNQLGGGTQTITFIKRSSGAVTYEQEWAGLQTQEVLRALIDRTKFLNEILPCSETIEALYHLRMSLYWYEVRAYRRKSDKVNRTEFKHKDTPCEYLRGEYPDDIPFTEVDIENREVSGDGHIII
jgi:hypothetical protein